jgi:hypothetical protein
MPRIDTRKRDRAAYFREYRARKAKENPALQAQIDELRARVDALTLHAGDLILAKGQTPDSHLTDGVYVAGEPQFGTSKPAPKRAAKG